MKKEDRLLEILNEMISLCEPITYQEFNKILKAKDVSKLRAYEAKNKEVGLASYDTDNEGIKYYERFWI